MLLTGTFIRSLDEKQRFSLPKSLREALGPIPDDVLYIAPGTDGSLALYPPEAFSQLAAYLGHDSPTAQDVRAFSRLFYAQAQRVEMDRQARIRIPAELVKLAELERDIVLVGVRDHMEIWNRGRWDAYLLDKQARYDEIAERVFERPAANAAPPEAPRSQPSATSFNPQAEGRFGSETRTPQNPPPHPR